MLKNEAIWIAERLTEYLPTDLSPIVELGSSTLEFRTSIQPWIEETLIGPLRGRGNLIVHCDQKQGPGIDIAGDIMSSQTQFELRRIKPKCILCCNMLEHVNAPEALAKICDSILRPGGYMVATVPYSYPYHLDPIDTYFRPSPEEISRLFPNYDCLAMEIIADRTYFDELIEGKSLARAIVVSLGKLLVPLGGYEHWKARSHRLFWLNRSYLVSGVILRKPLGESLCTNGVAKSPLIK